MKVKIRRAYEKPEKGDGVRILADRLWPRGLTKGKADIDEWIKELAPSAKLRKWYHTDKKARWTEFKKRYGQELKGHKEFVSNFQNKHMKNITTLVSANKDLGSSHIPILRAFLKKIKT